jgi:hypothetical protein
VVLRPQDTGGFVVSGASASQNPSSALPSEAAVRLALSRLDR